MKRFWSFLFATMVAMGSASAQSVQTFVYKTHGEQTLQLDFYAPENQSDTFCIVYLFGGGFKGGERTNKEATLFAKNMQTRGFQVATIDYRLFFADSTKAFSIKNMQSAIEWATADAMAAIDFLVRNANELKINSKKIIIAGSSAGAITALHVDYNISNRTLLVAELLPSDFRLAGVLAYAGGIMSSSGKPKYKTAPAPTLFVHGTSDKLVNYNKITFFNLGFFGTNALSKIFKENDFAYHARHYEGLGHEVAIYASYTPELVENFVKNHIVRQRQIVIDETISDKALAPSALSKATTRDLYNEKRAQAFVGDFVKAMQDAEKNCY